VEGICFGEASEAAPGECDLLSQDEAGRFSSSSISDKKSSMRQCCSSDELDVEDARVDIERFDRSPLRGFGSFGGAI
jgi:hypothetical protein